MYNLRYKGAWHKSQGGLHLATVGSTQYFVGVTEFESTNLVGKYRGISWLVVIVQVKNTQGSLK